jgi:hypothetical protein
MSATSLVPIVVLVGVLGLDLWVYADAKTALERGTPVVASIGRLDFDTPSVWFVGCLVLFVVVFPLYLAARSQR